MFKSVAFIVLVYMLCALAMPAFSAPPDDEASIDGDRVRVWREAGLQQARQNLPQTLSSAKFFSKATPEDLLYVLNNRSIARMKFDAAMQRGLTPLMLAAQYSPYPEIISILIKAGADPNVRLTASGREGLYPGHAMTPLHYAAWLNPNPQVLAELLKYKPAVNAQEAWGRTPLYLACLGEDSQDECPMRLEHVRLLVAAGASPDIGDSKDKQTPLMTATYYGDLAKVQAMLPYSNLETPDRRGATALTYAIKLHHYGIARELMAAGARVDSHVLYAASNDKGTGMDEELLHDLLKASNIDQASETDSAGRNIYLENACQHCALPTVRALLEAGARPRPVQWTLPYLVAAVAGNYEDCYEVVELLLKYGADPNERQGKALLEAIQRRKPQCVSALLQAGANPNLSNDSGHTPLLATIYIDDDDAMRLQLIKLLLAAGADPSLPDHSGRTPLTLAEKYPEVKQLLLEAQNKPRLATPTGNRNNSQRR